MQQFLQEVIVVTNDFLWSKLLIIMLLASGLFFTFKSKFFQVRLLKDMFRVLYFINLRQRAFDKA